jgi:hypothetical protein
MELEQDFPTKDELEFDELRANHGGIFELADKQGCKLKNCEQYERAYEALYEAGWQDELLKIFLEEQEYEDHIIYLEENDPWKKIEEDEQYDILYEDDDKLYHPDSFFGHKRDWIRYDEAVSQYFYFFELHEIYELEQDYEDCIIYLDDREQYDSEEDEIISHFEYDEWREMKYKMRNKLLYHQQPV